MQPWHTAHDANVDRRSASGSSTWTVSYPIKVCHYTFKSHCASSIVAAQVTESKNAKKTRQPSSALREDCY